MPNSNAVAEHEEDFEEPVKQVRCRRCHFNYPETQIVTVHGTNYCDGEGTNDCYIKSRSNGCRNGDCE